MTLVPAAERCRYSYFEYLLFNETYWIFKTKKAKHQILWLVFFVFIKIRSMYLY